MRISFLQKEYHYIHRIYILKYITDIALKYGQFNVNGLHCNL